jgi:hypothetical protein
MELGSHLTEEQKIRRKAITVYRPKVCPRCGVEFQPKNGKEKHCLTCRPIVWSEQRKNWKVSNPEKVKAGQHRGYIKHKDERTTVNRIWALANPEKVIAAHIKHRVEHREECNAVERAWRIAHPEKDKPTRAKIAAKRHRALSFLPMNTWFEGCEAHHINKSDVIFIPKELHKSICHNVFTGKHMEEINARACAWFTEDWT